MTFLHWPFVPKETLCNTLFFSPLLVSCHINILFVLQVGSNHGLVSKTFWENFMRWIWFAKKETRCINSSHWNTWQFYNDSKLDMASNVSLYSFSKGVKNGVSHSSLTTTTSIYLWDVSFCMLVASCNYWLSFLFPYKLIKYHQFY